MITDHFVFPTSRPIQSNILKEIEEAYKSFDFIMVEAPTGTGKSALAATTARWLGEGYINTSSLLLQDQYLRDFPFIKSIKGKSNFECIDPSTREVEVARVEALFAQGGQQLTLDHRNLYREMKDKRITCDKGRCQLDRGYKCELKPKKEDYVLSASTGNPILVELGRKICHYYDQKLTGMLSPITTMNYKYFFSMFFYAPQELPSRKFIAFDEAHSIENEIIDFIGHNISRHYYEKMQDEVLNDSRLRDLVNRAQFPKDNVTDIETWIDWLEWTLDWMSGARVYFQGQAKKGLLDGKDEETYVKIDELAKKIEQLIDNINKDKNNWIIDIKYENYDKTKIRDVRIVPIEIGQFVRPVLDLGEKKMFISATLLDKDVFANFIGVSPKDIHFIRVTQSPFPIQNRPIQALNIGEISYRTTGSLLPLIASNIDAIMDNHSDEKGLIHTTNYSTVDFLMKNLSEDNKSRLLVTGGGVPQSEVLKKHTEGQNTVLLSPSLYQGLDLIDDLARFQVVIKIPYPDISDKRTELKMKRSFRWYQWQTALRLVQSYGRIVRSSEDHGVTYILDSKLKKFVGNKMIPEWFKEAIIWR